MLFFWGFYNKTWEKLSFSGASLLAAVKVRPDWGRISESFSFSITGSWWSKWNGPCSGLVQRAAGQRQAPAPKSLFSLCWIFSSQNAQPTCGSKLLITCPGRPLKFTVVPDSDSFSTPVTLASQWGRLSSKDVEYIKCSVTTRLLMWSTYYVPALC